MRKDKRVPSREARHPAALHIRSLGRALGPAGGALAAAFQPLAQLPAAQAFGPQSFVAMIGFEPAVMRAEVVQRGGDQALRAANAVLGRFDRIGDFASRAGQGRAPPSAGWQVLQQITRARDATHAKKSNGGAPRSVPV